MARKKKDEVAVDEVEIGVEPIETEDAAGATIINKIDNVVSSHINLVQVESDTQLINGTFDDRTLFEDTTKGFFYMVKDEPTIGKLLIGSIKQLLADGKIVALTVK